MSMNFPTGDYSDPQNTPARKKLSRSTDRWFGGVCGGIADYFGIDALIVRLLFIASILLPGPQVLLYLVLWVVVPNQSRPQEAAGWSV